MRVYIYIYINTRHTLLHININMIICIIRYIYPIGSMYAIYGNIYHQYTPNVSIYTIHGSYGYDMINIEKEHFRTGNPRVWTGPFHLPHDSQVDANRWSSQRRLEAVPWLRKVCHNGSTLLIIVDNDGKFLVNDDFNGLILICGI